MTTLMKALSAAAVSMAAFAAAASVQAAEGTSIQVSDLNLNTAQGRAAFSARVETTARQLCGDQADLHFKMTCQRAVREEAYQNLHDQQEQIARGATVHVAAMGRR